MKKHFESSVRIFRMDVKQYGNRSQCLVKTTYIYYISMFAISIRGVKTVEGNDESLYCHGNLIIPLIKRGMMSDYAHVNHASVSIHNHSSFPS